MKQSRFTDSQILAVFKEAQAGTPVPSLCREQGISSATFYKWRSKYGGMDASMMPLLKELQDENRTTAATCCAPSAPSPLLAPTSMCPRPSCSWRRAFF